MPTFKFSLLLWFSKINLVNLVWSKKLSKYLNKYKLNFTKLSNIFQKQNNKNMLKKIQTVLNMVEVAENNLKNIRQILTGLLEENGQKAIYSNFSTKKSQDENLATEVIEGNFDGENMMGDNGQVYIVPQNYASKSQLIIGDRMKWILTSEREIFKLIAPVERERVNGTFSIDGENYAILVDGLTSPVRVLKASATFAIKNQGLSVGDEVTVLIPKDSTPTWGALVSVVKKNTESFDILENETKKEYPKITASTEELDDIGDFQSKSKNQKTENSHEYF